MFLRRNSKYFTIKTKYKDTTFTLYVCISDITFTRCHSLDLGSWYIWPNHQHCPYYGFNKFSTETVIISSGISKGETEKAHKLSVYLELNLLPNLSRFELFNTTIFFINCLVNILSTNVKPACNFFRTFLFLQLLRLVLMKCQI